MITRAKQPNCMKKKKSLNNYENRKIESKGRIEHRSYRKPSGIDTTRKDDRKKRKKINAHPHVSPLEDIWK